MRCFFLGKCLAEKTNLHNLFLFRFELALQQNEIMDVFYDDYVSLADEDSTFGSKSDNYLKVDPVDIHNVLF